MSNAVRYRPPAIFVAFINVFKAWRYRNRDKKQYEMLIEKIGKANMPEDVDKFVKIKYNNQGHYQKILLDFDLYRQYADAVKKGKAWLDISLRRG